MDGGGGILIGSAADDARSGRSRKFTISLTGGSNGASRRVHKPDKPKDQHPVRFGGCTEVELKELEFGASRGPVDGSAEGRSEGAEAGGRQSAQAGGAAANGNSEAGRQLSRRMQQLAQAGG